MRYGWYEWSNILRDPVKYRGREFFLHLYYMIRIPVLTKWYMWTRKDVHCWNKCSNKKTTSTLDFFNE